MAASGSMQHASVCSCMHLCADVHQRLRPIVGFCMLIRLIYQLPEVHEVKGTVKCIRNFQAGLWFELNTGCRLMPAVVLVVECAQRMLGAASDDMQCMLMLCAFMSVLSGSCCY